MSELNENSIELAFVHQLVAQGYTYYYGPDIAPYSDNPQRESFESVVLEKQFKDALERLNPTLPESALTEAYQKVISNYFKTIEATCLQYQIKYIPVAIDEKFEKIMTSYLVEKQKFA